MDKTRHRTLAIIQARMGSSRLPGKVLLDLGGEPMLVRVVERARRAQTLTGFIIATTAEPEDDAIAALCKERRYPIFRGSTHDVLDRYYHAARSRVADFVVRITADCPVIDPAIIDRTVNAFFGRTQPQDQKLAERSKIILPPTPAAYDFAANRLPPPFTRTYPIGLDVEVCSFGALEYTYETADQPHQREHVMPFMYEEKGRFNVLLVNNDTDYGSLRWTVDTPEDLELLRRIYAHFGNRDDFSWLDVLKLQQENPEMFAVNANIKHKTMTDVDERASGN